MIRKQDMAVLISYYLGFSFLRNLWFRLLGIPVTRIIAFHETFRESRCFLEKNFLFLAKHTCVVDFDDYFAGRLSSSRINVIITFDDGYQNWIANAAPNLKKHGLKATFFVTSGSLNLSDSDTAEFIRTRLKRSAAASEQLGCLYGEDLKKLAEDGFTIGGHTVNHSNLGLVNDRSVLLEEILEDKKRLEESIGKMIKYFAYPGGVFKNPCFDLPGVLKEAGYVGAVTTDPGFNTAKTDPYLLHRELTRANMPNRVFKARVYGNHDLVGAFRKR